ncbi:hypothetical protein [Methyloversatilis discipulorum]|uniref:hypothetical protein n=1 Tax=Methyloversatilis discipulorum TaxID=1119528 RepID=UPI003F393214
MAVDPALIVRRKHAEDVAGLIAAKGWDAARAASELGVSAVQVERILRGDVEHIPTQRLKDMRSKLCGSALCGC